MLCVAPSAQALTNFTWSGAASVPGWATGANWVGGHAPRGSVGTLGFPALASCNTCYQSQNNITGLGVSEISIDDGTSYTVQGNTFGLGAGGIVAAPSSNDMRFSGPYLGPSLTLTAAQTWSITGSSRNQQFGIAGTVTGSTHALAIKFGSTYPTSLDLQGNIEAGPVTVSGNGVVALFGPPAFFIRAR